MNDVCALLFCNLLLFDFVLIGCCAQFDEDDDVFTMIDTGSAAVQLKLAEDRTTEYSGVGRLSKCESTPLSTRCVSCGMTRILQHTH